MTELRIAWSRRITVSVVMDPISIPATIIEVFPL
jgi:hypothetical protein